MRGIEQDAAVAAIAQFAGIHLSKRLDQIGLAVEIECVLPGRCLHPVDPDRAAAFGLRREITRLAPFQCFFEPADAVMEAGAELIKTAGFALDYFEVRHAETLAPIASRKDGPMRMLVAAKIGATRLIDNIAV